MQTVSSVEVGTSGIMDGRLRFMNWLFQTTFLMFRDNHRQGSPIILWRLILAMLLFSIVGYQASYSIYYTINYGKDVSLAAALMVNAWMLQEFFSISFMIYWQLSGQFATLFSVLIINAEKLPPKSEFIRKRLRVMYIFFGIAIALIIFLVVSTIWMYYTGTLRWVNMDEVLIEGFGKGTGIISSFVIGYSIYAWLILLVFYIVVSSRVQQELETFNVELEKIGEELPNNREQINDELVQKYDRQVDLTNMVRMVNTTFEVYTFLMIASNIPTTIFTLLNFIQRLKKTLWALVIHLPELLFCIIELVALTMPPAKIHSLVHSVEGITFANKRIWIPHNEKTFQLASILISHSQQSDLGLSLWGYATITKSLILTLLTMPNLKESPVTHISIENPQLEKRLRLIKRLFKFTFMIFRSNGDKPKISKPRLVFAVCLLGLNLYQTFHVLWSSKDTPSDQGFGHYLAAFGILLNAYSQFVWCCVLFFYTGVCARLHEQINGFSRELKDIGQKSKEPEDIANELQIKYDQLTNLSTLVQKADSTFQVYAFLMISTNVPVTVLSLLQFLQFIFKSATDAAYFSVNVVICVTELAAITLPAARVYSAIHSIEPNLFANKTIWLPHNEKVYQIARVFISHANQGSLGITIWNFALISKGLILNSMPFFKRPSSVTEIDIEVVEPQLEKRILFLKRLFKFTFLIFRDNYENPKISIPRLIIAVAIALLNGYQTGFVLWSIRRETSENLISSLIIYIWAGQCFLSVIFTLYWQFGHFQTIFSIETWSNLGAKIPKRLSEKLQLWRAYSFFYCVLIFISFNAFVVFLNFYFPRLMNFKLMNNDLLQAFGPYLGIIGIVLNAHQNFIWLLVLNFYMMTLSRVNERLRQFVSDIKEIGNNSKDGDDLIKELQIYYDRLTNLTALVQKANSIFEVYTFMMVSTIIPILIFALVTFVQYLAISIQLALYYSVNIFMCGVELVAITMFPARIYSSIHSIEPEMYANKKIWLPYEEHVHQLANTLIAHSKQDGLGISLWNYALMTKAMILTTGSLILTYVILIEQMGGGNVKPPKTDF
ncbi:hypothetical protein M3Y97_00493800 [Aphelenchoides bicaudatus]|nr:hypothetical protein M3Y97_00493800 [Aphelenchoides bicaudatus]